jgi:hypothetical protein
MVTQMRQHSLVRQKFRYFGVIAVILIFTVALCWGLTHISKVQLVSDPHRANNSVQFIAGAVPRIG